MNPSQGRTFTRYVKALGIARGDPVGAMAYAESQNWLDSRAIVQSLKTAVSQVGISDYALPTPAEFDFSEFVRPLTVIGKLAGLRRVPARMRVIAATSGSTAFWSGERNPRPISRLTLAGDTLEELSVIAMLVVTNELLRSSSPSAEAVLTRDLAAAIVQAMDSAFIDHLNAGSAGVKPAAISYGTTALHSTGSSLTQTDADLGLMIKTLSDIGSNLEFATWILRPRTALYFSRLRGTGGNLAHPQMSVQGGTLLGLPAIVSTGVPLDDVGSPVTGFTQITLLDPSQILVADDGGGALQVSEQSTLEMTDSPSGGTTSLVSMWQAESACLKLTRWANWQRCRDGMAQVLDQVTF
jgi:HK97 family phage major capsid protein